MLLSIIVRYALVAQIPCPRPLINSASKWAAQADVKGKGKAKEPLPSTIDEEVDLDRLTAQIKEELQDQLCRGRDEDMAETLRDLVDGISVHTRSSEAPEEGKPAQENREEGPSKSLKERLRERLEMEQDPEIRRDIRDLLSALAATQETMSARVKGRAREIDAEVGSPTPEVKPRGTPATPTTDRETAASTILKFYRSYRTRLASFKTIGEIQASLRSLEAAFTLPPHLDFLPSPSTEEYKLAYTSNNTALLMYEHALNGLLGKLDEVESGGDDKVRGRRRSVVREVERALESLGDMVKQMWDATQVAEEEGHEVFTPIVENTQATEQDQQPHSSPMQVAGEEREKVAVAVEDSQSTVVAAVQLDEEQGKVTIPIREGDPTSPAELGPQIDVPGEPAIVTEHAEVSQADHGAGDHSAKSAPDTVASDGGEVSETKTDGPSGTLLDGPEESVQPPTDSEDQPPSTQDEPELERSSQESEDVQYALETLDGVPHAEVASQQKKLEPADAQPPSTASEKPVENTPTAAMSIQPSSRPETRENSAQTEEDVAVAPIASAAASTEQGAGNFDTDAQVDTFLLPARKAESDSTTGIESDSDDMVVVKEDKDRDESSEWSEVEG